MMPSLAVVQLLRLSSPGLPIGGFSYSQGMESALELGLVHDAGSARDWLLQVLHGPLSRFDAALLARAWRARAAGDDAALLAINRRVLASRDSREQRQENEQMGYSLRRLFVELPEGRARPWPESLQTVPLALLVAWALAAYSLQLDADAAVEGFLWSWLENQVMVLLKAMPMGQTDGQRLLSALLPDIVGAARTALELPDDELSNFAPGLAWVAMKHETQYSRLFRS
ncbi:urease accessory protein UreF [Paludibacterium yongneupense]|uniref:urease accessory protein UreF n=1 Tax=Paludibacterium yongneupense TaxID=400061 RepID=UPI0003F90A3C|nr:urease accessory UreF family protein [Paludibacterium yongneupense]